MYVGFCRADPASDRIANRALGITLLGGITRGTNSTDAIVARLEADWPNWQIWAVPRAVGGTIWCAMRWDGTGQVLNAASADELAESFEEASSR
jgi:hypothetical protein